MTCLHHPSIHLFAKFQINMNQTTDERRALLHRWIEQYYSINDNSLTSVSGDASFRRYFRFSTDSEDSLGKTSLIAVDAPPELENSQPFIEIDNLLHDNNLLVPTIFQHDLSLGFYIQEDFGDQLLLDQLSNECADELYEQAMRNVANMQQVSCQKLPAYDSELLQREMQLFTDWYLQKHLSLSLDDTQRHTLQTCYQLLENNALEQPQVFVHRDYHSRNLMLLPDNKQGIIDFQDAVKGPITYDLVSLLKDCYIAWPQNKIDQWLKYFHQQIQSNTDLKTFTRWFDLMGIQRHLKAVGIFCRLNYRDGKASYLNDIPRTLNYIKITSQKYPELKQLSQLVNRL